MSFWYSSQMSKQQWLLSKLVKSELSQFHRKKIGPIWASPVITDWAAQATDRRPDPQTMLRLVAGTEWGIPALTDACLAGFWPWPQVKTCPIITSETSSGCMFFLRTWKKKSSPTFWWINGRIKRQCYVFSTNKASKRRKIIPKIGL